jgi:predicted MFS family arabinose efflux permease
MSDQTFKPRFALELTFLTTTRIFLFGAYRMVFPFLPAIARGLDITLEKASLAVSARALGALISPVMGIMADKWGRKPVMLIGLSTLVAGLMVVWIWPTFPGLVISLLLGLCARTAYEPATQAYLADNVPYHRRGLVIGLFESSWSASFFLVIPVVGWLIASKGWQTPFLWLALATAIGGLLIWKIIPKDDVLVEAQSTSWKDLSLLVFRSLPARANLLVSVLITMANASILIVYGAWLEIEFGLLVMAVGGVSIVLGLTEISGDFFVAGFSDRLKKHRTIFLGLCISVIANLLLPILGKNQIGAIVGLGLVQFGMGLVIVSNFTLMSEIVPEARGTTLSLTAIALELGMGLGSLIAPVLFQNGIAAIGVFSALLFALALFIFSRFVVRHLPAKALQ